MIFEFLIVVRLAEDTEIVDVIHECLANNTKGQARG